MDPAQPGSALGRGGSDGPAGAGGAGGIVRLEHYTGDQINETQPVSWADKQPGDIIFYTYPGDTVPHHVVIYLGGDRILQAPETGQNVGYGALSEFPGQIATVRRISEP